MRNIRDILTKSQLFGGLPEEHLAEVEKIAVERRYEKGEVIFADGDEGIGFYLIASGSVNVYKLSPDGKEQILHIVKEGETLGAVPVFSGNLSDHFHILLSSHAQPTFGRSSHHAILPPDP